MNSKLSKHTKISVLMLYILIGMVFLINYIKIEKSIAHEYLFVLLSYYITVGLWIMYIFLKGFYIFEPATMVLGLTIITFSIEPLISMLSNDTSLMGFSVYDGCIKATIIYIVAMITFMFVYYNRFSYRNYAKINTSCDLFEKDQQTHNPHLVLILAYLFTMIGIGISLVDLLKQGYSLNYILSFGTSGSFDASEESLGVIINLRYFMIPGFLYLDLYSSKKLPKTLMRIIAIACLFLRNKRWIVIVIILSPICLYYIRRKEKPSVKLVATVCIIMALIIAIMQYMRGSSTSISGVNWENFNILSIWGSFSGNFDLYKTLYGAVTYFPDKHFYTLGQQLIFLTLVTCIPRQIWPTKPVSIIDGQLKLYFMGKGAVKGAWAYAQLTEFYVEFGIVGVVLFMGVFAKLCKYLKRSYMNPRSSHNLIVYAFMFPMLMQLVIRGYMPINFWAIAFMWIPVFIINNYSGVKNFK